VLQWKCTGRCGHDEDSGGISLPHDGCCSGSVQDDAGMTRTAVESRWLVMGVAVEVTSQEGSRRSGLRRHCEAWVSNRGPVGMGVSKDN
jgi:hypothetical protein